MSAHVDPPPKAIVVLLSDPTLFDKLVASPEEVDVIYDLPLEYCLTGVWPSGEPRRLSEQDSDDWPYPDPYVSQTDYPWRFALRPKSRDPAPLGGGQQQQQKAGSGSEDGEEMESDPSGVKPPSYRMTRFRTPYAPLKGLTSDIIMSAAEIAFGRKSVVEMLAPDQATFREAVATVVARSKAESEAVRANPSQGLQASL